MTRDQRHRPPPLPAASPAPRRRPGEAEAPWPQTLAVALDYDPAEGDQAPRVVASGRGHVAEQILALAFAHGVRVRADPDLAQILAAVEVDSVIPLEAFAAVAEVLAYVYRANGQPVPGTGPDAPRPPPAPPTPWFKEPS